MAPSGSRSGADRRTRLIDAAIKLFSERPYEEVSVQDIAAEAGVATGLLYYYFKDKQGLYAAGLEQLASELRARLDAAIAEIDDPLERLIAGLDEHLAFVQRYPTGYRELLHGAAAQPRIGAVVERERNARLAQMVENLPATVAPTPLVVTSLDGWLHFVDGVLLAWLSRGELDRVAVRELCVKVLASAVGAAVAVERGGEQEKVPAAG